MIGYEKTSHVAQKNRIISAVESTKHTDYTAALSVVIAHSEHFMCSTTKALNVVKAAHRLISC